MNQDDILDLSAIDWHSLRLGQHNAQIARPSDNSIAAITGPRPYALDGVRNRLASRIGRELGLKGWRVMPQRFKRDGATYYGLWIEHDL